MPRTVQLILIITYLIFVSISCQTKKNSSINFLPQINYSLLQDEQQFLDTLQYYSFRYFLNEINQTNGLVKDRSTLYSPASIAAVGFAYPVWIIGTEHGWISREKAAELTRTSLLFFLKSSQNGTNNSTGYRGFYYHFLKMNNGKREWGCELSTIDTAWLIAGMRCAAHYFNRNDKTEIQIRQIADSLTFRIDWSWASLPDNGISASTISMGWTPEEGFNSLGWFGYNEALYLYILAAGSGFAGAKQAYQQWLSTYHWEEPYPGLAHAIFPPLFGHQFSHLFIDFRNLQDGYMLKKGIDYFENSRRAVYTQWEYAIQNPLNWMGYDSTTWGISACDGPGEKYNSGKFRFYGYAGRGTSGPNHILFDDGTIACYASAASLPFAPEIVLPTLKSLYRRYADKGLWNKYGFVDAFNLTANWFDSEYLGIDQGPIIIMLENYRSNLIWNYCMQDPVIQRGLDILGFKNSQPD
jgi:hypothetical protein